MINIYLVLAEYLNIISCKLDYIFLLPCYKAILKILCCWLFC